MAEWVVCLGVSAAGAATLAATGPVRLTENTDLLMTLAELPSGRADEAALATLLAGTGQPFWQGRDLE